MARTESFEVECGRWAHEALGAEQAMNINERCKRFLEEALKLVQSLGMTENDACLLVDYVFKRPVGVTRQEIGGTAVTLGALVSALNLDLSLEAETELARCWSKKEQIREKQANKPAEIRGV